MTVPLAAFAAPPLGAQGATDDPADTAKRRQILEGAKRVFLEHGFDGASMNDITKAAGVSKGTIYAYFSGKDTLFEELIRLEKQEQAESLCLISPDDHATADVLYDFGLKILTKLLHPESIARVRLVMGITPRFPNIGRTFFETGYARGIARLTDYLATQITQGKLDAADPAKAAQHFFDICFSRPLRAAMLAVIDDMSPEEKHAHVTESVAAFFKLYPLKG
ncbi:TetR/AcrR family transcriptional regulator [Elstera cyanobacteriorum]|uniref:HTH tetR-type domain-containing protein n=1 Tax=Elstera cyanobacteriorum TaxID=2022747 RepID=A0A255XUN4_9PROT|nr:TetR/AcrR family transcriptional regulator [Elstera cyanobacteriorum]MCK6444145.1 TetR/AcrR family transcriptional regulator [Elstera cyanobacteriorum]OYQ20125.1 hypothetical protein CHR90_05295 [Elstera cyanobacteriorum]GFZ81551.1 TetR family transcriptional regulator [Elstera cyanobacteriorum]